MLTAEHRLVVTTCARAAVYAEVVELEVVKFSRTVIPNNMTY